MPQVIFRLLSQGVTLAAAFNPAAAIVGAVVAAMLLAKRPGMIRWAMASAVLFAAWVAGDGVRVLSLWARQSHSAHGPQVALFAIWVLGGFAFGYALPAWAGTFVGRRVTWGTGWLSAAVVAGTVSTALAALSAKIG